MFSREVFDQFRDSFVDSFVDKHEEKTRFEVARDVHFLKRGACWVEGVDIEIESFDVVPDVMNFSLARNKANLEQQASFNFLITQSLWWCVNLIARAL